MQLGGQTPLGLAQKLKDEGVRIVGTPPEAIHLAEDREAAELWLARNGYTRARLEEITADEAGADAVEGRAAA